MKEVHVIVVAHSYDLGLNISLCDISHQVIDTIIAGILHDVVDDTGEIFVTCVSILVMKWPSL